MKTEAMHHLTEEQLYRALDCPEFGPVPSGAEFLILEHLGRCAQCAKELGSLRTALTGFREATTSFAAARFTPCLERRERGLLHGMRTSVLAWPLSLLAAGVLCAASVSVMHRPAAQPRVEATAMPRQAVSPESDESLLEGISNDLSTPVPPSLEPLSVSSAEGSGRMN